MNLSTLVRLAIDHSELGVKLIGWPNGTWEASDGTHRFIEKTPEEAVKKLLRTLIANSKGQ